jgi:hypothetical protein
LQGCPEKSTVAGLRLRLLIVGVSCWAATQAEGTITREQLLSRILWELSSCLQWRNADAERMVSQCFACFKSERRLHARVPQPTAERD